MDDRVSSPSQQAPEKPYKPKFHNASLYTKDEHLKLQMIQNAPQPAQPPPVTVTLAPVQPIQQPPPVQLPQPSVIPVTATPTTPTVSGISHPLVCILNS